MKKILVISSLLVMLMFIVSCAPQITDEELEAELAKLTPEERAALLKDLENEKGTFAGQAIAKRVSQKLAGVSKERVLTILKKTVILTPPQSQPQCQTNADCQSGYGCNEGQCIGIDIAQPQCQTNADCQSGYGCNEGQCIGIDIAQPQCQTNADCQSGYGCNEGQCIGIDIAQP